MTKEMTKKKMKKAVEIYKVTISPWKNKDFYFFILFPAKLFRTQQPPTKTGHFDFLLQRMLCIGKHMYGRGQKADVILQG